jgi:hypothetical protein
MAHDGHIFISIYTFLILCKMYVSLKLESLVTCAKILWKFRGYCSSLVLILVNCAPLSNWNVDYFSLNVIVFESVQSYYLKTYSKLNGWNLMYSKSIQISLSFSLSLRPLSFMQHDYMKLISHPSVMIDYDCIEFYLYAICHSLQSFIVMERPI